MYSVEDKNCLLLEKECEHPLGASNAIGFIFRSLSSTSPNEIFHDYELI